METKTYQKCWRICKEKNIYEFVYFAYNSFCLFVYICKFTSEASLTKVMTYLPKFLTNFLLLTCNLPSSLSLLSSECILTVCFVGIFAFESEYEQWVEEQNRQICDLRTAVHADITDIELRILVENAMRHYFKFFRMKGCKSRCLLHNVRHVEDIRRKTFLMDRRISPFRTSQGMFLLM